MTRGWVTNVEGNVFVYRQTGTLVPFVDGIKKVVIRNLSPRTPGLIKFAVTGRNGSFAVDPSGSLLVCR